jgi:nucleoside-diphosphate-sugar epimerase
MNNILITGCNGLIGNNLVEKLKQNNLIRLFGVGRSSLIIKNTFQIDLSKDWSDSILPDKIDIIIHLAQSEKFREFPESAQEVFNVNTNSTLKLLDYARKAGIKKFIYASSGGVYGNSPDEFNEEEPIFMCNDLGFYLSTKFCSELLVQSYSSFFDIDILRFFFVFGEGQREDMLIPRLINSVRNNIPINLQGNEGLKLNPIYVQDAVDAIISCFKLKGNTRINIAGTEILTLRNICEIIGSYLNKEPKFNIKTEEPKHLIADISKMKELLMTPKTSFSEAVRKLIK